MAKPSAKIVVAEKPPARIWKHELWDLLDWYEQNLCIPNHFDPRGFRLVFSLERFPHLIKLLKKGSTREVDNPQKQAIAIKEREKGNADFGGYDAERAQTLSWILPVITQPTMILEVIEGNIWEKPGDTVFVKEFSKHGYRHKLLVCRTVGPSRLAPVTCHPRDKFKVGKAYKVVWPLPVAEEPEEAKEEKVIAEMAKAAD